MYQKIGYILALLYLLSSCGKIKPSGEVHSADFPVEAFSKLSLKGKYRAFLVPSEAENFVNIETYPNLAKNIKLELKDSLLSITENRETGLVDFYTITIYAKQLPKEITVADSVELNISGRLRLPSLSIGIKDQGKFIGALYTEVTNIDMQQKGRANLQGFTKQANIKISDTASIIAPYWDINYCDINSKNNNYTEVAVQKELNGTLENTSRLVYFGEPTKKIKVAPKAQLERKEKLNFKNNILYEHTR